MGAGSVVALLGGAPEPLWVRVHLHGRPSACSPAWLASCLALVYLGRCWIS